MKKPFFIILFYISLAIISCSKDNNSNSPEELDDLIVGIWNQPGQGTVLNDGTDNYSIYTYQCAFEGRWTFESNGNFQIITFDGPDNECFETGTVTGTWEKINNEEYKFMVLSDSNGNNENTTATLELIFVNSNAMRFVFPSEAENIDYSYEQYERIE